MVTANKSMTLIVFLVLATMVDAKASVLTHNFLLLGTPCEYQCNVFVAINENLVFTIGGATEIGEDDRGVFSHSFGLDGVAAQEASRLNSTIAGRQWPAQVVRAGDRAFASWVSDESDGDEHDVFGVMIDLDGSIVGEPRMISESPDGDQTGGMAASLADGVHLVVWKSSQEQVIGCLFDVENGPDSGEIEIFTADGFETRGMGVASNGLDRFVVYRKFRDPLTESRGLQFRLLNANGDFLGLEKTYDTKSKAFWRTTDVAMNRDGAFSVVWDSGDPYGYNPVVVLQRFDDQANAVGDPTVLSEDDAIGQDFPSVAMTDDGHAFVAWMMGSDVGGPLDANSHSEIAAVWLDPDGNKIGEIFQVNESTYWVQQFPDVAVNSDGVAAVVWTTYDELDGKFSLWGRLFQCDGDDLGPDDDDDADDDASDDSGDDDDGGCGC